MVVLNRLSEVHLKPINIVVDRFSLSLDTLECQIFNNTQLSQIYKEECEAEEDLEYWKEEKERVANLLIENLDEHELLDILQPVVVRTVITATGSVKMDVRLHKASYLSIYGNVPAVVDGSIRVLLTLEGKTVGTAICTIKYGGVVSTYDEGCICMNIAEQASSYDYSFEPNHLWAVERK